MHSSVFWYLLYLLFFNSSNITKTNEDISGMGEKEIVFEYLAFINFKSDSFISLDVVFNSTVRVLTNFNIVSHLKAC